MALLTTVARQNLVGTPLGVVRFRLSSHQRITSGDYAAPTGLTQAGALNHLDKLVGDDLLVRGEGKGRNAHFLRGSRPDTGL